MSRHVFTNAGCTHAWAHQTSDHGRSGNHNLYFEGPRLYSHGSHFMVGALLPNGVVLLNNGKHSISTTQHQSFAVQATRHLEQFAVPKIEELYRLLGLTGVIERLETGKPWSKLGGDITLKDARHSILIWLDRNAISLLHSPFPIELLSWVGLKPDTWVNLLDKARKRQAKATAKREAVHLKRQIREAAELADLSEARFEIELVKHYPHPTSSEWNWSYAVTRMKAQTTMWRRSHKIASKHLSKRRKVRIWNRVKLLAAHTEGLERRSNRMLARNGVHQAIKNLRNLLPFAEELRQSAFSAEFCRERSRELFEFDAVLDFLANDRRAPEALGGGLKSKLIGIRGQILSILKVRREELRLEETERRRLQRIAEMERQARVREDWIAGVPGTRFYGSDEDGAAYLRAVDPIKNDKGEITGGILQTSQGASVPLAEAFRAFRFLKMCRDTKTPWVANGTKVRVGHFLISSIDEHGNFRAACHFIKWSEVSRIATELGVLEFAASNEGIAA